MNGFTPWIASPIGHLALPMQPAPMTDQQKWSFSNMIQGLQQPRKPGLGPMPQMWEAGATPISDARG